MLPISSVDSLLALLKVLKNKHKFWRWKHPDEYHRLNSSDKVNLPEKVSKKGWYTYDVHVEAGWRGKTKMGCCRTQRGGGVSECSGSPIFILFIKENWICAMIRRHAEPNIKMLLTRNPPLDSYVRQWNHPLIFFFFFVFS